MKFSVIIPIFNAEKYITNCLDSILKQDYDNYEIILIDDGSTDNSLKICKEYEKKYSNIIIYHQENLGVSVARNKGICLSSGEYILFIDIDDEVSNNMFRRYLHELKNDDVEMIICGYKELDIDSNSDKLYSANETWYGCKNDFLNDKFEHLFYNWLLHSPWNKLFKSSIIKKHKITFNTNYSIYEDICFVLDYLYRCNNIKLIPDILYTYITKKSGSLVTKYHSNAYIAYFDFNRKLKKLLDNEKVKYNLFIFNKFIKFIDDMYLKDAMSLKHKKNKMKEIYNECNIENILKIKNNNNLRILIEVFLIKYHLYSILHIEHFIYSKIKKKL